MKKMKKILLFSGLLYGFSVPVFAQETGFTIRGKVKNTDERKVYLQAINERGLAVTIDSVALTDGNRFEFRGDVKNGGGFYKLNLFNRQSGVLLLEGGETLLVEAEGQDYPNKTGVFKVSGSKNMEYYTKVNDISEQFKSRVNKLNASYATAVEKKDKAKQEKIKLEFEKGQTDIVTKIKALLPEMGSSLAALYATNFLNQEQDFEVFEALSAKFTQEKPNAAPFKKFVSSVRRVQATKRGLVIGQPAPEISLPDPTDKTVSLSSLKGKYVLIDFWAAWCGPCRRENPNVVKLYEKYKSKGFEILGVSLDSDKASWLGAIAKDGLTWPQVSDLKYFDSIAAIDYGVPHIPFTVLLDKDGNILAKELRGEALEKKIAEIFGE